LFDDCSAKSRVDEATPGVLERCAEHGIGDLLAALKTMESFHREDTHSLLPLVL
jgi:hypothetical protein